MADDLPQRTEKVLIPQPQVKEEDSAMSNSLPSRFHLTSRFSDDCKPKTNLSDPSSQRLSAFSPTKDILPIYFSYLERFQYDEATRLLDMAGVCKYNSISD